MKPAKSLPEALRGLLRQGRLRRRVQALVVGCAWACLGPGLLLCLALGASAVGHSPFLGGPSLWVVCAGLSAAGSLAWSLYPVWSRTRDDLRLARALDDRVPATADALHVAVDLCRSSRTKWGHAEAENPAMQPEALFVEAHLRSAEGAAAALNLREALPWSVVGRSVLVGPLVLLLGLAWLFVAPERGQELLAAWSRVGDSASSDRTGSEAALQVRNLRIRLEPPAYTGRSPWVLDGTSGDFQALPGTRVAWQADAPTKFQGLRLHWPSGGSVDGSVSGSKLSIEFVSGQESSYRLAARRRGSTAWTRSFRVEVLPDRAPSLEVQAPPGDHELRPGQSLTLNLQAWDDFGLTELRLVVLQKGREVSSHPIASSFESAEWSGTTRWSPSENPKALGGELALVIEAKDNDTVSGPKVTRSRPISVYVPTLRDHHRRVLQLKEQLLNQGLDLLASLLRAELRGPSELGRSSLVALYEEHAAFAAEVFQTADVLHEAMRRDELERQDQYVGIGQGVDNVVRRWRRFQEVFEAEVRRVERPVVPRYRYDRWVAEREPVVSELERLVLDLASFADLHRGGEAQRALGELEPELADLASLLRKASQGERVDEALEAALEELQQRLTELQQMMSDRSRGPRDSFVNRVPQDLGPEQSRNLAQLIQAGHFDKALELVRQTLDAVAQLQDQLQQGDGAMAGGQEANVLREQLTAALERTEALELEEQEILEATRELESTHGSGEAMSDADRGRFEDRMSALGEVLDALPPPGLSTRVQADVKQRMRRISRLHAGAQEAWTSGHPQETIESLRTVAMELEAMDQSVAASAEVEAPREQARSLARTGMAMSEGLADELEETLRRSSARRERLAGAAEGVRKRQTAAATEAALLHDQLGQIGGGAFNPVEAREGATNARKLMNRAAHGLQQGRAEQAIGAEQDALSQLRLCKRSLEGALKGMEGKGAMGQSGAAMASQSTPWSRVESFRGDARGHEVEIPDPEDFVSPEAFRALLQEGASEEAPRRYKPLNRSYYEELVR